LKDKSRLKIDVGNAALAMIKNATSTQNECSLYARVSMMYFLQLLVNKFGAAEEKIGGRSLVEIMVDLIHSCDSNPNELEVERYYQTLSYFTAAALACRDKSDQTLISLMVQGIKDPKAGRKVARSFRILLGPSKVMCKENFCLLRPIRQGRLFQFAVEEIIKLWRAYSFELQGDPNAKDIKTNCLIALTGCLAYMDTKVYLSHVNEVFPLILEGTNVQNDDFTKLACITIIRTLVPVCPGVIESHLDSVINRMTNRTHNTYYSPSDANVASRAAALEVLALLPRHIDKVAMLKRKNKVISELDTALADVSMEVRIQAQKCKMWYFNLVE
jgi:DNA repair/transcription protein MET18/MMS19